MSDLEDSDWSTDSDDSSDDGEEAQIDLKAPKPIKLKTPVWDAKFHPSENVLVAGDLDGVIRAWRFNDETNDEPEVHLEKGVHGDSIRGISFSPSGDRLFSIGTDRQLLISDVSTGTPFMSLQEAFEDSPYCISSTNENVIATGDESGTVRLFDIRKKNPIDELLIDDGRCEDTINDIYQSTDGKFLLVASADGTLSAYNQKAKKFIMESESMGSDLCSVIGIKNEQKAIVSASDGYIHLYNWEEFGHPSDMFPGHIKGDLVCCKMTEDVILTGDVKGQIQAVNILPNRILQTIGTHQKGIPVERLDVFQNRIALSIGVGSEEIRFWNLENISPILEGSKEARKKAKVTQKSTKIKTAKKTGFFSGFGNDLNVNLDKNLHSSEEEEESEQETEVVEKNPELEKIPQSDKIPESNQEISEIAETSGAAKVPPKRQDKNNSNFKNKRRKKNAKPVTAD